MSPLTKDDAATIQAILHELDWVIVGTPSRIGPRHGDSDDRHVEASALMELAGYRLERDPAWKYSHIYYVHKNLP